MQHVDAELVSRLRAAGCVFAEDEAALLAEAATSQAELDRLVGQRIAGLPLEHILGWVEFAGRRFEISPGLFVPRRRTELLPRCAIGVLPRKDRLTVVDICCGCGAIGATIAGEVVGVEVYATDIDPIAVSCAQRNLAASSGQAFAGDLYEPLPKHLLGNVDQIVANAPYVPTADIALMPSEARDHEPHSALDGGPDGLDILHRVVLESPPWLSPDGTLLIEVSQQQAPRLVAVAHSIGRVAELITDDEIGGSVLLIRPADR